MVVCKIFHFNVQRLFIFFLFYYECRLLTQEQFDVILAKLRMCPSPLFLKLCCEQARAWHSYTPRDQLSLGITVRSLIEQMFIRLERDHGKVLVSKALGKYLYYSNHFSTIVRVLIGNNCIFAQVT